MNLSKPTMITVLVATALIAISFGMNPEHSTEAKSDVLRPDAPPQDTIGSALDEVKPDDPIKDTTASALAEVKPANLTKGATQPKRKRVRLSQRATKPNRTRVVGYGPAADQFAADQALKIYWAEKAEKDAKLSALADVKTVDSAKATALMDVDVADIARPNNETDPKRAMRDDAPVKAQPESAPDPEGSPDQLTLAQAQPPPPAVVVPQATALMDVHMADIARPYEITDPKATDVDVADNTLPDTSTEDPAQTSPTEDLPVLIGELVPAGSASTSNNGTNLEIGTVVRLKDLVQRADFNGRKAEIIGHMDKAGKYPIRIRFKDVGFQAVAYELARAENMEIISPGKAVEVTLLDCLKNLCHKVGFAADISRHITKVWPGGPADEAGLRVGQYIASVDRKTAGPTETISSLVKSRVQDTHVIVVLEGEFGKQPRDEYGKELTVEEYKERTKAKASAAADQTNKDASTMVADVMQHGVDAAQAEEDAGVNEDKKKKRRNPWHYLQKEPLRARDRRHARARASPSYVEWRDLPKAVDARVASALVEAALKNSSLFIG